MCGDVLAVVSDKKEQVNGVWQAIVLSAKDYYPFGMSMPGRVTEGGSYRYGFNGKETDPETDIQDYGMRWYLPNIARFPSVDPITKEYPELTPFQFASNTPIQAIDLDGLEALKRGFYSELGFKGVAVYRTASAVHVLHTYNGQTIHTFLTKAGSTEQRLKKFCIDDSDAIFYAPLMYQAEQITKGRGGNKNGIGVMKAILLEDHPQKEELDNSLLHFMGSALTSLYWGEKASKYIADLHERDFQPFISEEIDIYDVYNYLPIDPGQESMLDKYEDAYRDLINNEWGRKFGTDLSNIIKIDVTEKPSFDNTILFLNKVKERFEETFKTKLNPIDKNDPRVIGFHSLIKSTLHSTENNQNSFD